MGGEKELEDIPVDSLRNGLKLFQFTEGAYYALEAVDLGGDAGALPARVDEAIRQGADLIVVTHPFLLHAAAAYTRLGLVGWIRMREMAWVSARPRCFQVLPASVER